MSPTHTDYINAYPKSQTIRNTKYMAYIRKHPCLICGGSPTHAHHEPLKGKGIGLKGPDNESLPLCHRCHMERHQKGRKTFYKEHGIDWRHEVTSYQQIYEVKR